MEAFLSLGSNLGNKLENLKLAIISINRLINTKVIKISKIYETEPVDVPDKQSTYLNCCIKVETDFNPEILLGCCLGIESSMGRTRPFNHASRVIDIDLLLYENIKTNSKNLTLPHPRMLERAFVIVPLLDIYNNKNIFLDKLINIDKSGVNIYLEDINFE